jgi:hypothetical protein
LIVPIVNNDNSLLKEIEQPAELGTQATKNLYMRSPSVEAAEEKKKNKRNNHIEFPKMRTGLSLIPSIQTAEVPMIEEVKEEEAPKLQLKRKGEIVMDEAVSPSEERLTVLRLNGVVDLRIGRTAYKYVVRISNYKDPLKDGNVWIDGEKLEKGEMNESSDLCIEEGIQLIVVFLTGARDGLLGTALTTPEMVVCTRWYLSLLYWKWVMKNQLYVVPNRSQLFKDIKYSDRRNYDVSDYNNISTRNRKKKSIVENERDISPDTFVIGQDQKWEKFLENMVNNPNRKETLDAYKSALERLSLGSNMSILKHIMSIRKARTVMMNNITGKEEDIKQFMKDYYGHCEENEKMIDLQTILSVGLLEKLEITTDKIDYLISTKYRLMVEAHEALSWGKKGWLNDLMDKSEKRTDRYSLKRIKRQLSTMIGEDKGSAGNAIALDIKMLWEGQKHGDEQAISMVKDEFIHSLLKDDEESDSSQEKREPEKKISKIGKLKNVSSEKRDEESKSSKETGNKSGNKGQAKKRSVTESTYKNDSYMERGLDSKVKIPIFQQKVISKENILLVEEMFNIRINNQAQIGKYLTDIKEKEVLIGPTDVGYRDIDEVNKVVKWRSTRVKGLLNRLGGKNYTVQIGICAIEENAKKVSEIKRLILTKIMIGRASYQGIDCEDIEDIDTLHTKLEKEEIELYRKAIESRIKKLDQLNRELSIEEENRDFYQQDEEMETEEQQQLPGVDRSSIGGDSQTADSRSLSKIESKKKKVHMRKGLSIEIEEIKKADTVETILKVWEKILKEKELGEYIIQRRGNQAPSEKMNQWIPQVVPIYYYNMRSGQEEDLNDEESIIDKDPSNKINEDTNMDQEEEGKENSESDYSILVEEWEESESELSSEEEENPNKWENYKYGPNILDREEMDKYKKYGWNTDNEAYIYETIHPEKRVKLNTVWRYIGGRVNKLNKEYWKDVYRHKKIQEESYKDPIVLYDYIYDYEERSYQRDTTIYVEMEEGIMPLEISYLLHGSRADDILHTKYWEKPYKYICPFHNPGEDGGLPIIRYKTNTELDSALNNFDDDKEQTLLKYSYKRGEDTPIYYWTHIPKNTINLNSIIPWLEYGTNLEENNSNEFRDIAIKAVIPIQVYALEKTQIELEDTGNKVAGYDVITENQQRLDEEMLSISASKMDVDSTI